MKEENEINNDEAVVGKSPIEVIRDNFKESDNDFFFESHDLFNGGNARFIRIALLAGHPDMDERINYVKSKVKF